MGKDQSPTGQSFDVNVMLAVWKQAVETQMHFNELSIKTRQLGVTVVGAILAFSIAAYEVLGNITATVCGMNLEMPTSAALWTIAAGMVYLIKILDVDVYHRLLRGAVKFSEEIEYKNLNTLCGTSTGLAQSISDSSRQRGRGSKLLGERLSFFYHATIILLIVGAFLLPKVKASNEIRGNLNAPIEAEDVLPEPGT